MDWSGRRVLVTGGCSFIGSHLVDALVARGAWVRIADDLSSGRRENVAGHLERGRVELLELDLLGESAAREAVDGVERVFHLAARHGGRGYIDLHQADCATNLALDGLVIRAAQQAGVEQFTFASSGCVYPTDLQRDPDEVVYLSEDLVGPPYRADDLYGWAKLMAELTLRAYHREYGLSCASVRYFTAYGERCTESHAVIAMIARAFVEQDPYVVWGTGEQIRNWTYVGDIVQGTLLASERIRDGTAVNLGTTERIRVIDAAREILRRSGHEAEIVTDPSKPTGPYNRVADNALARELLGWTPQVKFAEGLERTLAWYRASKDADSVRADLERLLMER